MKIVRRFPACFLFGLGLIILTMGLASSQSDTRVATPAEASFFEIKIRPVLINHCYSCHGPQDQEAGLRLDSIESIKKGGRSGPAIVPGDPDKSLLVLAVRQSGFLKMPQGGKLKPEEVEDLAAWVKTGAIWPTAAADSSAMSKPLWSLQPVVMPVAPKVRDKKWIRQPLDAFVLASLEAKHIKPAPVADRRTLLRRVTYDLTGLPPTLADTEAFLKDTSHRAYEKVVDRLLASPHYGERWARHWMDVARYADTKGYVFTEDPNFYNAYTYRDWLINAFNGNMPYNRFILYQLAADRLPEVQHGEDKRPLAALGFLTIGRRFLNSRPDIIDDRIDVTMRGFQGLTVSCARCHDHKFDPIPTQDYYSLYAVFDSSQDSDLPISDKSISEPWNEYNQKLSQTSNDITTLILDQTNLLRQQASNPEKAKDLPTNVKRVLQSLSLNSPAQGKDLDVLASSFDPKERAHLADLQRRQRDIVKEAPTKPEFAMALQDDSQPHDGVVFKHGNPGSRGEAAPRRFLLALTKTGTERTHWTTDSGRLELAEAIASDENPLTARVFVNRLWQDHFGDGIVRTSSDFGHQGDKPTNSALLDELAATFMSEGWDIKKVQKQIVTSATYMQSSTVSRATFAADPDNAFFSRMNRRRLDLEEMHDSVLEAAGNLDLSKLCGKSVDLWSKPFSDRRAVYGFIERQNLPGIFRTFDLASPDRTSPKRFFTTVPQQALFFMNSEFCIEASERLAQKVASESTDDRTQITLLYQKLFQRAPRSGEMEVGIAYLKQATPSSTLQPPIKGQSFGAGATAPPSHLQLYAQALMMTNEFMFVD